jgi:hypothetical protein
MPLLRWRSEDFDKPIDAAEILVALHPLLDSAGCRCSELCLWN